MNLCFMIIHSLMFVLGVDYLKKQVDYSGLKFTVDQGAKFKDELTIISNFFNDVCASNIIHSTNKEYLIKYYVEGAKSRGIPFRFNTIYFEDNFNNLSDVMKLNPSYMFLNKILKAGGIEISHVFGSLNIVIRTTLSKAIDMCNFKIRQLKSSTGSDCSHTIKIYEDYIDFSTKLRQKILHCTLTYKEAISGSDLSELIFLFLGKFYENDEYSKLVPAMNAYTYNN